MRLCARCVLPDTFPGIQVDDEGVCNLCRETVSSERRRVQKTEYQERFEHLIRGRHSESGYDVLLCYSGGKDSTFTLAVLKKRYGLRVLALTMDNGFMSSGSMANIRAVVGRLGIDHLLFAPRFDVLASICSKRQG